MRRVLLLLVSALPVAGVHAQATTSPRAGGAVQAAAAASQRPLPVTEVLQPLTAEPGDVARGRAIVADRRRGLCLLCHAAPIPEERFQGNLAPDLAGAGARWSVAQLRGRLVDPSAFNPDSMMPSYTRTAGLHRVGAAWVGVPVLAPQQVEDVVAWLATLRD